jgi:hypothetical protein
MMSGPMQMVQPNGNPKNCALIQNSDNIVINMIVADPTVDPAPEGCTLIALPDDSLVTFGWIYSPSTQQFAAPVGT